MSASNVLAGVCCVVIALLIAIEVVAAAIAT